MDDGCTVTASAAFDALTVTTSSAASPVLPPSAAARLRFTSDTSVLGLAARVNITGAEAANDRLTINALAGDDVVEASGLAAGAIQLTADGGDGDDVLIGGAGDPAGM